MRSLRTWLALGLMIGIAVPAGAGLVAWAAAGAWQTQRLLARRDAAVRELLSGSLPDAGLTDRLSALGVEAEVQPAKRSILIAKEQVAMQVTTTPGAKTAIERGYPSYSVDGGSFQATLWVRPDSAAVRWAIALAAAGVALAGVLLVAVALLSRWVLRPLASLAGSADRMAGGELTVQPVATRAREVAQVGEALSGMAGALETALGTTAASERERRFLISAIAHDLRTPLFTLRGSLEAIEHGIGDGAALARAQRKADHLDRLVGDLFSFSRTEYARETYVRERVDLGEIARRAIESVGAQVELAADGPVPLLGDPVALERVLTNVLDNATRHARSSVRIAVRRSGRAAVAEITDDGPGFADEDLPHVFEPLFRGDRSRSGGGRGLGLAIARRFARAHGGDVTAANDPAGGARVIVTFAAVPSLEDDGHAGGSPAPSMGQAGFEPAHDGL